MFFMLFTCWKYFEWVFFCSIAVWTANTDVADLTPQTQSSKVDFSEVGCLLVEEKMQPHVFLSKESLASYFKCP